MAPMKRALLSASLLLSAWGLVPSCSDDEGARPSAGTGGSDASTDGASGAAGSGGGAGVSGAGGGAGSGAAAGGGSGGLAGTAGTGASGTDAGGASGSGAGGAGGAGGADAALDAPDDTACGEAGLDAGTPLDCATIVASGPSFDPGTRRVTLPLPGVATIVSGTFEAVVALEGGPGSFEWLSGTVTVTGGAAVLELVVPDGAGTIAEAEVCSLDLVDACGQRHVLDRFAMDDAGNRAELPRFQLQDASGTWAPLCRMDYDLCND